MTEHTHARRGGGLGGSIRRFTDGIVGLLQTRIEILSVEWAEERGALLRLLLVVFSIVVCLQLALVTGLVFLLLVVAPQHRVGMLGIAALALLLAAVGGALWIRHWLKHRPPMFGTTIAELKKDRDWIRGRS